MTYRKYRNRKVRLPDGTVFDSVHEYQRWRELLLLQRAGQIADLQRQVKFLLIPAQTETFERYSEKTGKRLKDGCRTIEKECSYVADFVYTKSGVQIVEDAKGMRTPEYIIKRKLMLWVHGIRIQEV